MNFNLTAYELALVAGGFTIIGALLGNWISHRFSDYRDRRKERNEAADELFAKLSREKNCIVAGNGIGEIEFEIFGRRLSCLKRSKYRKCVEAYKKAKSENIRKESKRDFHIGTPAIKAAIDDLLKFTERI